MKIIKHLFLVLFLIAGMGERVAIAHDSLTAPSSTELISQSRSPLLYDEGLPHLSFSFVIRTVKNFSEPNSFVFQGFIKSEVNKKWIQNKTIDNTRCNFILLFYKRLLIFPFHSFW